MGMDLSSLLSLGIGQDIGTFANVTKSAYGFAQMLKANKALKNMKRPTYTVDPMYERMASQGIPQATANAYFNNINQNTAAGIDATVATGGDQNSISQLIGKQNGSYLDFLSADANARITNQKALADQKRVAWDYNENIPYQQAYNAASQMSNSGAQNAFGGLSDEATLLTNAGQGGGVPSGGRSESGSYDNMIKSLGNKYDSSGWRTQGTQEYGGQNAEDYSPPSEGYYG